MNARRVPKNKKTILRKPAQTDEERAAFDWAVNQKILEAKEKRAREPDERARQKEYDEWLSEQKNER